MDLRVVGDVTNSVLLHCDSMATLQHLAMSHMVGDPLTKSIPRDIFKVRVRKLRLRIPGAEQEQRIRGGQIKKIILKKLEF
jgi:hypothetical protein